AGRDQIAWFERHDLRYKRNYSTQGENQIARIAVLLELAVERSADRELGGVEVGLGHEARAYCAKSVKTFAAGELDVLFLQVARRDVVHAGIAEGVGQSPFG